MFRQIFFAAALAGVVGGIFVTGMNYVRIIPLILEAETYETAGGHDHGTADATAAGAEAAAVEEEWAPADGVERGAYTLATNILMAVGIALLLAAGFALTGQGGWRAGLYWGLAGYAAFILAPALGLPPEVPGAEAAPLADRQLWWLGTVAATAGGLALMFLTRSWRWIVAGAALIVLPHLIGAPQPEHHGGLAPASLAREFVAAVLVTGFLFWLALGALSGFFYKRFAGVPT
ncbi:MAG: CbtA family protein [Dongiaceae bacterium]